MPDFALLLFIINKRNRLRSTILVAQYFLRRNCITFPFVIYPHSFQLINLIITKSNNGSKCNININVITTKIFCTLTYYINIDTIIIHNIHQLISTTIEHSMVMMQGIWPFYHNPNYAQLMSCVLPFSIYIIIGKIKNCLNQA